MQTRFNASHVIKGIIIMNYYDQSAGNIIIMHSGI